MRTITGLSAAWDGEPIKRVRATETVILCGRRIGMHLMVQPEVAATALTDELLNKQGFMSRILACAPEGLIGKRMHKAPPLEATQVLRDYEKRILSILETPYLLAPDTRNELEPRAISFSTEAEELFWEFADAVEKEMASGGEYESIKPFAAKLPEHAARLATAIAKYRDCNVAELSREDFFCGIRIATYYATEAKRISGSGWTDFRTASSQEAARLAPTRLGQAHRERAGYLPLGSQRDPGSRNHLRLAKSLSITAGSIPSRPAGTTCESGRSFRGPTNEHPRFHRPTLNSGLTHADCSGLRDTHTNRIGAQQPRPGRTAASSTACENVLEDGAPFHWDVECRSAAKLGKGKDSVGARAYAEHFSTEILCVSFARGMARSRPGFRDSRSPRPCSQPLQISAVFGSRIMQHSSGRSSSAS